MFKTYMKNYVKISTILSRSSIPIQSFNKHVFLSTVNKKPKKETLNEFNSYTHCRFCKGKGFIKCTTCHGICRIYKNAKEYKCDNCIYGEKICDFCGATGKSHLIF